MQTEEATTRKGQSLLLQSSQCFRLGPSNIRMLAAFAKLNVETLPIEHMSICRQHSPAAVAVLY